MDRKYSPQLHPSSLPQGTQVGPWLVESWRGSGTYGAVYRAVRLGEEAAEPVALKVAVNPGDQRFEREVTLLSRIQEAHVPALRDHGQWACADRSFPYLAMQWVEGVPLYEWSEERNPTSRQILRLLAQIARALAATHAARGVHRDVKGDNVLVRSDGQAFLMDFGSSIYAGAKHLTWEPLPPGTRTYRTPEAWRFGVYTRERNAHYDSKPADDLFALGITAYRLVTDEYPPSTDPGQIESVIWYVDDPSVHPPPPRALNPRVDRHLNTLILRMLSLRPEDRGTAENLAKSLERRAANAGAEADLPLFAWERLPRSAWPGADAADANSVHHRRRHRAQHVVRATEQRELAERAEAARRAAEPPSRAMPPPEPTAAPPSTPPEEVTASPVATPPREQAAPPSATPPGEEPTPPKDTPPREQTVLPVALTQKEQATPTVPVTPRTQVTLETPVPLPTKAPPSDLIEVVLNAFAAAAIVLLVVFVGWLATGFLTSGMPAVAQVDQADAGTPDGGTAELGAEVLSARVTATEFRDGRPGVSEKVPSKPMPGQSRPGNTGRCRVQEVPINGGCWTEIVNAIPPCPDQSYEWRGGCYYAVYTAPREPTSTPE